MVLKNPNVNREERLRQLHDIKRRKDYFKSRKFTLSRRKYTAAKGNEESPNNITTVQSTVNAAQGVMQTGGVIRTAVGGTRNTVGRIQTAVNRGVSVGSVKDVGKMATVAKNATTGAVKEAGHSLLRTRVDKTTTTDTGTEAIKQGLTDIRYADNARKAVGNTVKSGIKTARSVKEAPKAVGRDVQRIREKLIRRHRAKQIVKAKKTGKAAKKTVGAVRKVVTSKGFIAVAIAAAFILLIVVLLTSVLSMILSAICSLFSWLIPGDGKPPYEYLLMYQTKVQEIQTQLQEEIDEEYEYTPEYRWDDTEITGLNQYKNMTLDVDINGVIAATAAKRFAYGDDMLRDDDLKETLEEFYTFDHHIDTGYCPDLDCKREEKELDASDFTIPNTVYVPETNSYDVTFKGSCYDHTGRVYTEIHMLMEGGSINGSASAEVNGSSWQVIYSIDSDSYSRIKWDEITINTTTDYCDNPDHKIYYGEVVNLDVETALEEICLGDEDESVFWTIYDVLQDGGL